MTKPPLGLTVQVTTPNGVQKRWASNSPARDRPSDIEFSTARMDGFKSSGCSLPRRIDQDSADLNLLDDFALIGEDGSVAFEGRVAALPRSMDATHQVSVQAVGWMAHTKDRKFQEIYVDRDLSRWGKRSVQRSIGLVGTFTLYDPSLKADETTGQPALVTSLSDQVWGAAPHLPHSEAVYSSQGIPIGSVYYAWKKGANVDAGNAVFHWVLALDDEDTFNASVDVTAELRAVGPGSGTLTATGTRYFTTVVFYSDGTYATASQKDIYWTVLATYGAHGLTKRGVSSDTEAQGFYASDVITDIANRFCPKLNTAGVVDTSFVIPHLEFIDPIFPYDAMLRCNGPHLWGLEVWENKTLHYGPVDLTDYDWQIRLSDPGVTVDLQGDTTTDLANGIAVNYQDVNTGRSRRLTPDVYPDELSDPSTDNPANRVGFAVWTEIAISYPTTEAAAVQIGRAALAEFNAPKAPGTISVRGHIRDRAGHWQQPWKVRAGETIAIVDHPNDRPRLIVETDYTHEPTPTVRLAVDSTFRRLDAFFDRMSTALAAANIAA